MAIFLSSLGLALAIAQTQTPVVSDSAARAALWARVQADSTDAPAWLELGRLYLRQSVDYHEHRTSPDTVWAHAVLDTAQQGFTRAARWSAGTRTADSAQVFRLYVIGERGYVDWEAGGGAAAATLAWHTLPEGLRLPPVLEELGENLLRACPHQGILFTANEIDTQAAWYLRFARGLRPDLVIVPLERWKGDSVVRGRVLRELKARDPSLKALGQTRAVCASMAFERPPDERPAVSWKKRPVVWVSGKESRADRVPSRDFGFAALRLAIDQHETWAVPVLEIYRRAAANVSDLCRAMETFSLTTEVGCR